MEIIQIYKEKRKIYESRKDNCTVQTKKGFQYSCIWANEYNHFGELVSPTIEQVNEAWKNNRNSFEAYSCLRGY